MSKHYLILIKKSHGRMLLYSLGALLYFSNTIGGACWERASCVLREEAESSASCEQAERTEGRRKGKGEEEHDVDVKRGRRK